MDHNKFLSPRFMDNVERLPVSVGLAWSNSPSALYDVPNSRYMLDFWGDEGVASLGYGQNFNQFLDDFTRRSIPHRLPDVYPNGIRNQAAEAICSRTGMDKIFFASSGTEANEAAIKLARKYWWDKEQYHGSKFASYRHYVFTLEGNFHGRTGFSLAASDYRQSPYHRQGFGPIPQGFGVLNDNLEVVDFDGNSVAGDSWTDTLLKKTAAVIMAPVLGNNVVKTYPSEFWDRLQKLREKYGFLLIFDDVQAGSGRSGYYATYQGLPCIKRPDIMTLSKGMAMGLPMSAMLASEEVAKSFTRGVHFNTFGGTILCCYLAIEFYKWLDENLPEVKEKGERIRKEFSNRSWIRHYDGMGLMNAFRPLFDKYDGFDFVNKAREFGLFLVTHRKDGMIRFTPPMNVTYKEIDSAFKILDMTHESLFLG